MLYELDTAGQETVLFDFHGVRGVRPSFVTRDAAGNLYGTTSYGGAAGNGTVFELDTSGKETVLYSFGGLSDGENPYVVILDSAGNLYGTAQGGAGKSGVVYKIDTAGRFMVLYSFMGGADGQYPESLLVRDSTGNLYGTAVGGGAHGAGLVFEIGPQGGGGSCTRSPDRPTEEHPLACFHAAGNLYGCAGNGEDNFG